MQCVYIQATRYRWVMMKSYRELRRLETFEERFEYLRIRGEIGKVTFGFERYLNQVLYHSNEWHHVKKDAIVRDDGCDLGIPGYEIQAGLLVHHINSITIEDVENGADCIFDLDNLITTTLRTHNAIHFGNGALLSRLPVIRKKSDTCLW